MKIYIPVKKFHRIVWIALVTLAGLVFFLIQSVRTEYSFYNYGFYVFLVINILMIFTLYGFFKARIEIDDKEIRCPSYPWYEGFRLDESDFPHFLHIAYTSIRSLETIKAPGHLQKEIPAILIRIVDKYDVCLPLDGYEEDKVVEIWKELETAWKKSQEQAS